MLIFQYIARQKCPYRFPYCYKKHTKPQTHKCGMSSVFSAKRIQYTLFYILYLVFADICVFAILSCYVIMIANTLDKHEALLFFSHLKYVAIDE